MSYPHLPDPLPSLAETEVRLSSPSSFSIFSFQLLEGPSATTGRCDVEDWAQPPDPVAGAARVCAWTPSHFRPTWRQSRSDGHSHGPLSFRARHLCGRNGGDLIRRRAPAPVVEASCGLAEASCDGRQAAAEACCCRQLTLDSGRFSSPRWSSLPGDARQGLRLSVRLWLGGASFVSAVSPVAPPSSSSPPAACLGVLCLCALRERGA
jgi:hypothetical protein